MTGREAARRTHRKRPGPHGGSWPAAPWQGHPVGKGHFGSMEHKRNINEDQAGGRLGRRYIVRVMTCRVARLSIWIAHVEPSQQTGGIDVDMNAVLEQTPFCDWGRTCATN